MPLALVPCKRRTSSQDPKTTPFDVITNLQNASSKQSARDLGKFVVIVINLQELCS